MGVSGSATSGRAETDHEFSSSPLMPAAPPALGTDRQSPPALAPSASAPCLTPPSSMGGGGSPTASLTNAQYKKEVAYKEAMDRHICAMEARAAEAIAERQAWSQHMDECLAQERDEIQSKRTRAQMNLHFL